MTLGFARFRAALAAAALLVPLSAARGHAQVLPGPRDDTDARLSQYRSDALREAGSVLEEWRTAWAEDDLRALMRFYDRKALVQLPGDEETLQGSASVETALKSRLPGVGGIEFALVDAEVSGNLLYIFHRYLLQRAPGDSAAASSSTAASNMGTTAMVLIRERGGWKIRAQMFIPAPQVAAAETAPAVTPAASGDGHN
ncbi:MAG TPA: nuclear transport factor 2 family protein [Longimicrobium sp.]|nr:nuclear transport factor 2 family protein [Longimicrobium sp.]